MPTSHETFQTVVLGQLAEGVIVADADGRIVSVNRSAEEIHGRIKLDVAPGDYTRTYALLTMEGEPFPPGELPLARAVRNGETVTDTPWKIRRPDGSIVIAVGSARPVFDKAGKQIGSVLTMRDETLRFEAERQLQEALHLKDMLLFEVNHRVRNSLQIVSSVVSLALQRLKDEEARTVLRHTRQRIDVISATHRSLYEMGTHDHVDCTKLLPELTEQIVRTYEVDHAIELNCEASGAIVLPVGKAVSLCLTVTEMVTNACKYAFEGRDSGRIDLVLDGTGEQAVIDVRDNGVGVRDETGRSEGTGIGMTLIDALSKSIGATIERRTGPEGTAFRLRFDRLEFDSNGERVWFDPNRRRATPDGERAS